MSENALDAIVLMEGTSLRYFTGVDWWGGERLFALVLPAKGAAFYVCPAFEEGRAREQLATHRGATRADLRMRCEAMCGTTYGCGRRTRARTSSWRRA
jgi:Xaa-Pro aminopeptidase